jgi:methionyl-tRNA formyltransferase
MRIAYFCTTGSMSLMPLSALAAEHDIVLMVRPSPGQGHLRRRMAELARKTGVRKGDTLDSWAREHGVRTVKMTGRTDPYIIDALKAAKPDLICISSFRYILGESILSIPLQGAVNLHCTLLPRHRGPIPLFWIYHADDRETGVTAHEVTGAVDAGRIYKQESFTLARGRPVEDLNEENARRGARVLVETVSEIASGSVTMRVQDESLATSAPMLQPGERRIDFETWPVERVWHFLAGLCHRYKEPLLDTHGRPVRYGTVGCYEPGASKKPGTTTNTQDGWLLHCRDGVVKLLPSSGGVGATGVGTDHGIESVPEDDSEPRNSSAPGDGSALGSSSAAKRSFGSGDGFAERDGSASKNSYATGEGCAAEDGSATKDSYATEEGCAPQGGSAA